MSEAVFFGLDLGSVSIKLVALDRGGNIISSRYQRHHGQPLQAAVEFLKGRAGGQEVVEESLRLLTHLNPLAITQDWDLAPVPGMVVPDRWVERVRRFLYG